MNLRHSNNNLSFMYGVYLFWYCHPFVFFNQYMYLFSENKYRYWCVRYLNMMTSNPIRFKSSYAVLRCMVLLVKTDVGFCEVWYTFKVKVQHIIQMWSQIELALLTMFLNGFCSHAETNIQHNNHGILDTTSFNCIKNFFQFSLN
jgi:hypothetical protein